MATNRVLASSLQPKKGGLSLFNLSDQDILNQIYATHVHDDKTFDAESLFIVVENVLKHSTEITDKFVLGQVSSLSRFLTSFPGFFGSTKRVDPEKAGQMGPQTTAEHVEEKTPKLGFNPPLCTLKGISCEETAYKTALSVLKKSSNYSWEAKAVLILAAFALDYGEFWLLVQTQLGDQFAKSVGTLRGVSVLLKPQTLQKHKQALYELNNVVRATVKLIECIFEFEKLFNYDTKEVPALSTGRDQIPVDVFWAIVTVVASTTQFCCLTNDSDEKQQLSQFHQQLNKIHSKLETQRTTCNEQIAEIEHYRTVQKLFGTPTEIMETFKALINPKDKVTLSEGPSGKSVDIDVLKRKTVLLFISQLDISDDDIKVLRPIYESIRKEDRYKIVWIPIVDQWTEELQKKFEILRAKMPWYTVPNFSSKAGIKFVKEKWNFKGKPQVVVLNPQTKVEHEDAMHMFRLWGTDAFPLNSQREQELLHRNDWFWSIVSSFYPKIDGWVKEQKYIFFYGGKDNEWIQKFHELLKDVVITGTKIPIELQCVGKDSKGKDELGILGQFWTHVESTFISKICGKTEVDTVTLEIQKLFSYKNESGWVVLTKGSNLVLSGHGTTILKALKDFEKWKELARDKGFEFALKEYHSEVVQSSHICRRIDITNTTRKIPEHLKCPDCHCIMETYTSFNCCHISGAGNALH